MQEYTPFKSGKVREMYDIGDSIIMVASDRISVFDVILQKQVPLKGAVLNLLSKFWFDFTQDIVPNHMITVDNAEMPEFFQQEQFQNRSLKCKKLKMLPVECIVRGYITGSGWKSYLQDGTICGIRLPEGLQECQKLPEPIYTPSTKAEIGDHDLNISAEESAAYIEKAFPGKGQEYAKKLQEYTMALYQKCADYALTRGIIIPDTKFEFGVDEEGNIVLGDEVLTPDNSRFWPLAGYEAGHDQPSYDKQYVRNYVKANGYDYETLPEDVIAQTIAKYKEAYELLTGEPLEKHLK